MYANLFGFLVFLIFNPWMTVKRISDGNERKCFWFSEYNFIKVCYIKFLPRNPTLSVKTHLHSDNDKFIHTFSHANFKLTATARYNSNELKQLSDNGSLVIINEQIYFVRQPSNDVNMLIAWLHSLIEHCAYLIKQNIIKFLNERVQTIQIWEEEEMVFWVI